MAKCRMLLHENDELGKMITSGRTSKLEAEIALQKSLVAEMKANQDGLCVCVVFLRCINIYIDCLVLFCCYVSIFILAIFNRCKHILSILMFCLLLPCLLWSSSFPQQTPALYLAQFF